MVRFYGQEPDKWKIAEPNVVQAGVLLEAEHGCCPHNVSLRRRCSLANGVRFESRYSSLDGTAKDDLI